VVTGLIALAATAAGCGFDNADIAAETPPLQLGTGTTPVDSTEYLFDPAGIDLVVGFKRPMDGQEVTTLQLVPTPERMGEVLNPATNPRQILLQDVVLDTVYPAYHLVLDGATMIAPEILTWFSGKKSAFDGAIQGHVFIPRGDTRANGAMVYALVPPGLEHKFPLHGGEETILGMPIVGATRAIAIQTEEGAWFRLGDLLLFNRYVVLAILDINGDGRYELEEDWWGYYRDEVDALLEVASGVAFGSTLDPPLPELRTNVDFWILRPGSLDPGLTP
jgi:hypothetical protein